MTKTKLIGGKALNNKLDKTIREIFHLLYGENPTCFVCGHRDGWFNPKTRFNGIQVGHFISRQFPVTRWFLLNLFCQCSVCNRLHNINPAPFTLAIIKVHGIKRVKILNDLVKQYNGVKISNGPRRELLEKLLVIKKELEYGHLLTNGSLSVNIVV